MPIEKTKAQVMEESQKDNVLPEQKQNSDRQPIELTSSPANANTFVVGSQSQTRCQDEKVTFIDVVKYLFSKDCPSETKNQMLLFWLPLPVSLVSLVLNLLVLCRA